MGKALLVIVLGAGLVLTKQLYNVTQHESATAEDQTEYREEVIAREIAQSAFNVGMGEVRAHGEDIPAGVRALNGTDNAGREGQYTTGRFGGGSYSVKAELTSGHSVRVVATGRFGDAEYTMHDEYRVPVLTARFDGLIDVSFLESQAGYCSAVFYQAYTLDTPEGTTPTPVMLFPPDNRDRTSAKPAQTIYVEAGTQMNFFIAVDKDCSERFEASLNECQVRATAQGYVFDASDFDHVHQGLEVVAGALDQAHEAVWGIIEQHPTDRQRWRVGWEDLHTTSWDNPESDNPRLSLQALKRLGYDSIGWPEADAWQYRKLRDYGDRPDFSDQVIEVNVIADSDPNFHGKQTSARARQAACGEPIDAPVVPDPEEVDEETQEHLEIIEEAIDNGAEVEEPSTSSELSELQEYACSCTNNNSNGNVPILHRPPGNESNEQLICIGKPAVVRAHMKNHNDVYPSCPVR